MLKARPYSKESLNPCKGNGQYLKSSKKCHVCFIGGSWTSVWSIGETVKIAIKLLCHNGAKGLAKLKGHGWVVWSKL